MRRRHTVLAIPLALAMIVALAAPAAAAPGDLDPTFSGDGKVRLGSMDGGADAARLQVDGKLVMVGSNQGKFAIARLNIDGTLDTTFSGDGLAVVGLGVNHFDSAEALAISNGKIVVVGSDQDTSTSTFSMAILRLNSDGTLDTTFSGDGFELLRVGSNPATGASVALQSDGKIVAGGTNGQQLLVERRLSNGDADTSFSGDGAATVGFSEDVPSFLPISLGIDPTDGRIVIGSSVIDGGGFSHDFALAAFTLAGVLDTTFSTDGKMLRSTSSAGGFGALKVLSDGRIVAVGVTNKGLPGDQFLIEKYTRTGAFDTTFGGGDGASVVGFTFGGEPNDDAADAIGLQSDGKLVVAGRSTGQVQFFAVARLSANGALDTTFGINGGVLTAFAGGSAAITGLAINNNTNKIDVVGVELQGGNIDAALAARYLG